MNNKYIFTLIIFLIIESFFVSNISANHVLTRLQDNNTHNLISNQIKINDKYIKYPNNKYSSISFNNYNLTYEYIIITSIIFINSSFQTLIAHKSQYMNATIVTLEDIQLNPSFWVNGTYGDGTNNSNGNPYIENGAEVKNNYEIFNDTTAKIRNFIRFAHHNWKTKYVLLGGDVEIIPVRKFYVNISKWDAGLLFTRSIEGWIPSDLYYGNLNGTWNNNYNEKFGERGNTTIKEEADFSSEVFIGRAPIDNSHDIATFVYKVITFETMEKPKNILLHQSNLTPFGEPDTSVIPEACAKLIPDSYTIDKLYQKDEIINETIWANSFKDKLLHLHIGNGYFFGPTLSWYLIYFSIFGTKAFSNYNIGQLTNKFFPIHISISCLCGNFEYSDCLAEELLLWPNGGPSACIFNSEVGCVKKENPIAYSGEYIERLFYEFFVNKTRNLGKINQFSKMFFINISCIDPNYRWVIYETNLLGDPETPVFDTRIKLPNKIVYVDDDNKNGPWYGTQEYPYQFIQDGIQASNNYATVYVYNGTYAENIIIDKTIQLIGESKYSTIIDGNNNENTIIIKSNSSIIENFTILHSNNGNKKFIGIFIPIDCWGNKISNNIITKNNKFGIIINESCHTLIFNNTITLNGVGICLRREINNFFETSTIVITCSNIIRYNEISSNEGYGVYIEGVLNNHICNNNFINNSGGSGRDAYFLLSRNNEWDGNYWNEPRTDPKIIWGILGPLHPPSIIISGGFIFPYFNYKLVVNFPIPKRAIDKNPAQEPYNIQ